MGSPEAPTAQQYAALERAAELILLESPAWLEVSDGAVKLPLTLPHQGVSLLKLSWATPAAEDH
jgi:xylan 1,4-beta-xylosidase